ncbi:hypothetical protein OsJ_13061 [Oryza sativa Japonica Group]|uniref:Uncharacterized protein n=1 Tax=Oryza sativa subsp. japonica TaxID=39947 RepID=A3ANX4_ORYSJ|nr:hypothetical protein OsJ_13061 [Oryza sativa Japonica Group]
MAVSVVDKVWAVLAAWVSSCLTAATAVARALRAGDIGVPHVGLWGGPSSGPPPSGQSLEMVRVLAGDAKL